METKDEICDICGASAKDMRKHFKNQHQGQQINQNPPNLPTEKIPIPKIPSKTQEKHNTKDKKDDSEICAKDFTLHEIQGQKLGNFLQLEGKHDLYAGCYHEVYLKSGDILSFNEGPITEAIFTLFSILIIKANKDTVKNNTIFLESRIFNCFTQEEAPPTTTGMDIFKNHIISKNLLIIPIWYKGKASITIKCKEKTYYFSPHYNLVSSDIDKGLKRLFKHSNPIILEFRKKISSNENGGIDCLIFLHFILKKYYFY